MLEKSKLKICLVELGIWFYFFTITFFACSTVFKAFCIFRLSSKSDIYLQCVIYAGSKQVLECIFRQFLHCSWHKQWFPLALSFLSELDTLHFCLCWWPALFIVTFLKDFLSKYVRVDVVMLETVYSKVLVHNKRVNCKKKHSVPASPWHGRLCPPPPCFTIYTNFSHLINISQLLRFAHSTKIFLPTDLGLPCQNLLMFLIKLDLFKGMYFIK